MGLIIKSIKMLMVGYPTVSDKYNVTGGLLSGSDPVHFGDLVMHDGNGFYKKVASATSIADIAGFVLATNVKLVKGFADNEVLVNPGEAFNLVLPGSYLAVSLGEIDLDDTPILPNGKVYVDLTDGSLSLDSSDTELPGVVLTGTYELHGDEVVAEILVK